LETGTGSGKYRTRGVIFPHICSFAFAPAEWIACISLISKGITTAIHLFDRVHGTPPASSYFIAQKLWPKSQYRYYGTSL